MTIKEIFNKHKAEEGYGPNGLCRLSLEDDFYKKCVELESQLKESKSDHTTTLQLLLDIVNRKIDFDRKTVKSRIKKYIDTQTELKKLI